MSVSLQKGQKVSLSKEGKEGLNRVIVGLGWDEAQPPAGRRLVRRAFFRAYPVHRLRRVRADAAKRQADG